MCFLFKIEFVVVILQEIGKLTELAANLSHQEKTFAQNIHNADEQNCT